MASIEQDGNLWVVYDDEGGFTEFRSKDLAMQFFEEIS